MTDFRPIPEQDLAFVLSRTKTLWSDLRGGRMFITGGTGFFGRWMLETFLAANDRFGLGATVTVLGRDPARLPALLAEHPALSFVAGDVRSFGFPEGEFTHVLHLATDSTSSHEVSDVIVRGTRRVLRLAAERGTRRFLFASSGAVYGSQPFGLERIPEGYVGDPKTSYGEGKREAERFVSNARGFDATIARGFAFVGPSLPLDAHFAVGNLIRDAILGRPLGIKGDGTAVRSYLDAADLAVWLWTILFRAKAGRIYNVGSERAVTIRELADIVVDATDSNLPVSIAACPTVSGTRYIPDTRRAREELGLHQTFPLEEAVRRTIDYHRVPLCR